MHCKAIAGLIFLLLLFQSPVQAAPRMAANANKPGEYNVIISADKSIVEPGDKIKFSFYITGYGYIEQAKLFFSLSEIIHDPETSIINTYNATSENIGETGSTIRVMDSRVFADSGIMADGQSVYPIILESPLKDKDITYPPYSIEYKILKDTAPGRYYISAYLTYFGKQRWRTASDRYYFEILSPWERDWFQWTVLVLLAFPFFLSLGTFINSCLDKRYRQKDNLKL